MLRLLSMDANASLRIVRGMTQSSPSMADQSARPRIPYYALTSDSPSVSIFPFLLRHLHGDEFEFHFQAFRTEDELLHWLPQRRWGGIIAYLWDVRWNIPKEDETGHRIQRVLQQHRELHPDRVLLPPRIREVNIRGLLGNVHNGVRALKRIHREHGIPTVAKQGLALEDEFEGSGVMFYCPPMTTDQVYEALAYLLQSQPDGGASP